MDNDDLGFLRLPQVLQLIPVSKSTWWAGVKSGRYPAACKTGRITMWRRADIMKLVQKIEGIKQDEQTNRP
jgi:prophage regulatory protein